MSIQQFMNNNDYVKSTVSQYLGAESLKNKFTNEVLKEYNDIKNMFKEPLFRDNSDSYTIKLHRKYNLYFQKCIINYAAFEDQVYCRWYTGFLKKYILHKIAFCNYELFGTNWISTRIMNEYDEPPSVILQSTYFD